MMSEVDTSSGNNSGGDVSRVTLIEGIQLDGPLCKTTAIILPRTSLLLVIFPEPVQFLLQLVSILCCRHTASNTSPTTALCAGDLS